MRSAADRCAMHCNPQQSWRWTYCPNKRQVIQQGLQHACASSRQDNVDIRATSHGVDRKPLENVRTKFESNSLRPKRSDPSSRDLSSRPSPRADSRASPRVNTASVRKRIVQPPDNDQLPGLAALIIVEGFNDCVAVHKAVRSPVYVLGGGYALAEEMRPELQYIASLSASGQLPYNIVVFTDPDWQGRMFRTYLDDQLRQPTASAPGPAQDRKPQSARPQPLGEGSSAAGSKNLVIRHAFLRVEEGTSGEASRYHEAGNVGVEHASPDTIRRCLVRARPGFGPGRTEFTVEQLREAGLVGSWDDKGKLRRARFCRALGIDEVGTGKGLVNLLNRFYTREDYEAALKVSVAVEA